MFLQTGAVLEFWGAQQGPIVRAVPLVLVSKVIVWWKHCVTFSVSFHRRTSQTHRTHFLIELNEKMCPNVSLFRFIFVILTFVI